MRAPEVKVPCVRVGARVVCQVVAMVAVAMAACTHSAPAPVSTVAVAPQVNSTEYYDCIKRGADQNVRSVVTNRADFAKVDIDSIASDVLANCMSRISSETMAQTSDREYARLATQDALTALMAADYANEMEQQRKQALSAEDAAATRRYGDCLKEHTRVLALKSSEPAAIVVQAAMASCSKERSEILDVHRRYHDTLFDEDVMKMGDYKIAPKLLLEVMRARAAAPPLPSMPVPVPPDSQI